MTQSRQQHQSPLLGGRDAYTAVTDATYTAKAGDRVIGVNRAGAVTITLPSAEVRPGRSYTIKDESGAANSNNITVATEGSETIDGSATDTISDNYGGALYYSDGSNWFNATMNPPATAHQSDHNSGGGDPLRLDDLNAPEDNTDLDFSTSLHGLVPKGPNTGTYLKDDGTWSTLPAGDFVREGGNTTEASTTSTSTVSILTASSLTIPVGSQVDIQAAVRKITGASAIASVGLKLNTTQARADSGWAAAGNENMAGLIYCRMFPYGVTAYSCAIIERGGNNQQYAPSTLSGGMPTAELTDVIITGSVGSASITMYADELQVWTRKNA